LAGYHAPFDRFKQVAVCPNGPTFLNKCERCGALWHETLRDARLLSFEAAALLYPDANA